MNLGKSFATAPKELKFNNKVFTHPKEILEILESEKFYWLIDSTISDAIIEIKNNTLIWHDGNFLRNIHKRRILRNLGKRNMGGWTI